MALSKIDVANMLTGTAPVANGGTGVTSADEIGNLVKISTATLSSDASAEFDLDSTYDHFLFRISKLHISADTDDFACDFSLTSDTDYGSATLTYLTIRSTQSESSGNSVGTAGASSTGTLSRINLFKSVSADNDHALEGTFEIYNPSNTTFTKGVRSDIIGVRSDDNVTKCLMHGDIRSSTAVDKIKFFCVSGNLDSGTITQYGVKT